MLKTMNNELPSHVAVIGAGFAGLAAALRLAKAGVRVTVLESLSQPGGKAALGYSDFSSGPTVVTMPQIFKAIHQRVGLPQPILEAARPTTIYHAADGRHFAPEAFHVAGHLESTLIQLSKREGQDYQRLLSLSRQMYLDAAPTFLFGPPPTNAQLARYAVRCGVRAKPWQKLSSLVRSGPFLTPFWLRFATYLGANPYYAPAILHNIAWVELGHGVWHLRGGILQFAQALCEQAKALGVRFEFGTRIKHLSSHGGRVLGAHTTRGAFAADAWVSAADRSMTLNWLGVPEKTMRRGVSGFALQMRLTHNVGQSHHIFWPKSGYSQDWREIQANRLSKDPTLYLHLDGERAFLLVNTPSVPEIVTNPKEYGEFLFKCVQHRFPLPVKEWRHISPNDYARTAVSGALYGRAPHGLSGSLRADWALPQFKNIVQVGGSVHPGGGVPLSMLSGWNGTGSLLGLEYDDLDARQELLKS